jgi:hypothetical protein
MDRAAGPGGKIGKASIIEWFVQQIAILSAFLERGILADNCTDVMIENTPENLPDDRTLMLLL